jgi:hypothetical protein
MAGQRRKLVHEQGGDEAGYTRGEPGMAHDRGCDLLVVDLSADELLDEIASQIVRDLGRRMLHEVR